MTYSAVPISVAADRIFDLDSGMSDLLIGTCET